jgi:hypothetical protein
MKVVKRVTVTTGPKRHRAFPGLLRLRSGELLLTYREGSDHWKTDDAVLQATRSKDDGETWSEPVTLLSEAGWGFSAHHGPTQLADGSVLAPAMSLRKSHVEPRGEYRVYTLRSHDEGRNWDIRQIGPMPGWRWQNQYGRIMEIDGTLWLPGGGQREGEEFWRNGYFVSYDNGESWPEWHTLCTGLQDEKDMLEFADQSLLAMIRSGRETYRSCSSDRGKTWTVPKKLPIFGQCPSLLLLPSGTTLFAYREVESGNAKEGVGFRAKGVGLAVSNDRGRSWSVLPRMYDSPEGNFDCAYPSMVLARTNEVLCAYYTTFRDGDSHIELATIHVSLR